MHRLLLLLLLVAPGVPSWAANKTQPVTALQLGQFLAAARGRSDAKIAKDLQSMFLTERVPAAQLAQWQAALAGRHSRDALTALADAAMLLPLPPDSLLPDPPPDIKTQGAIFSRAIDYVVETLAKLPDFSATRTTAHFEDAPASLGAQRLEMLPSAANALGMNVRVTNIAGVSQQVIPAQPLHLAGLSSIQVSYRDGIEMRGAQKMDVSAINQPMPGLATAGEFGPILTVVLKDAVHGHIEWNCWQQSPAGKLAVFHYAVPDGGSSYVLALKHGNHEVRLFPGYHGEIAIDPGTGAILHITLVASSLRSLDVMESAIAVDYGPIPLGGKDYICPLKGVALLKTVADSGALQTQVNDATFADYHLLRGDVTILPIQQ